MFKSYGLKPSALSKILSSLVPVTLEVERKRGDVGFIFSLEHNKMIFILYGGEPCLAQKRISITR